MSMVMVNKNLYAKKRVSTPIIHDQSKFWNKKSAIVALVLILILASVIRIMGFNWGYPHRLHSDEGFIVDSAIEMAQVGTLEAKGWETPGHIIKIIASLSFRAFEIIVYGVGMQSPVIAEPQRFIYVAITRIIMALFGIATVWLVYFIGSTFNRRLGIIMSFLFAFYPLFAIHAHNAVPDISLTFFIVLFIYFALLYTKNPNIKFTSLMSAIVAVGTLEKLPALFSVVVIAILIIVFNYRQPKILFKHALISIIVLVATMFLISPHLFLRFGDFYTVFQNENRSVHLGADGLGFGGNLFFYIRNYTNYAGIGLLLLTILGLIRLFFQRNKHYLPFLTGYIFLILISTRGLHWERWGLPIYAGFLMTATFGVDWLLSKREKIKTKTWRIAIIIILLLIGSHLLVSSFKETIIRLMAPDTRIEALVFVKENGITKDNSIFDGYTPFEPGKPNTLTKALVIDGDQLLLSNSVYQFAIASSLMYGRYLNNSSQYSDEAHKYDLLFEHGDLIIEYFPSRTRRSNWEIINIYYSLQDLHQFFQGKFLKGPTLKIYDISSFSTYQSAIPENSANTF